MIDIKTACSFCYKTKWISVIIIYFSCVTIDVLAQNPDDGGIPNAEIVITKDRQIVLPKADRNFDKIQPRQVEPIKHDLVYQLKSVSFNSPTYSPIVRPLKLKEQEIPKIFSSYAAAGFGNYSSPYLEGFVNSKRERNKEYGVHFYHRSFGSGAVDDGNSASGRTELNLQGKFIGKMASVGATARYEKASGNFYGYLPIKNIRKDTIEQHYSRVGFELAVDNVGKSIVNYKIKTGYSSLGDNFKANEGELYVNSDFYYKIAEATKLKLGFDYFMLSREDEKIASYTRQLVKFKPAYEFLPIEKLLLTIGANLAFQNDPQLNISTVSVFPALNASYKLNDNAQVYGLITGDVDKVSLRTLSNDNFWINSNQKIANTKRALEFSTGVKGKVANKFAVHVGISLTDLKGYYFFQNNVKSRGKFDLIYDEGSTKRTNLFAELGFNQQMVKLNVRGDYFNYSRNSGVALHLPSYKITFNSNYNVFGKILLDADLIILGGMKALDNEKKSIVEIPSAVDLSLKADYLFSRNVSFFVKGNNLLASNYQLYLNYPVRGLQALVGVSCTF
jgi:hypothetical protein